MKSMVKKSTDPTLQKEWMAAKRQAKQSLARYLQEKLDLTVDVDSMFDCQFKRIHEYKRQFLNALYLIHRYFQIKDASPRERARIQKRTTLIGGKAAPGYVNAKIIIKLINNIAAVVNNDPDVSPYLKVAFIPNYSVSVAEHVIPASDISEHISTAGTEEGGEDTMFIFGALEEQIPGIKARAKEGSYPVE